MSADAFVRVPSAGAWVDAASGSFSALAWVRPTASGDDGSLLDVEGLLRVTIGADGRLSALLRASSPERGGLELTSDAALTPGGWALVCVSFDAARGEAMLWQCAEGQPAAAVWVVHEGFAPGGAGPGVTIGASGGLGALAGVVGAVAMRWEALSPQDMSALWTSAEFNALQTMTTLLSGGAMSGAAGCRWMVGHAMATEPSNGVDPELPSPAMSSNPGDLATWSNVIVLDRAAGTLPDRDDVVRPVEVGGVVRHVSPYDVGGGAFFQRASISAPSLPANNEVAGPAGELRRLWSGPVGLVRVMTSANSRAVRSNDGSGRSPGNYAHGFFEVLAPRIAGVLNRPAPMGAGPWFGFDCADAPAHVAGDVDDIAQTDFSRFWTGSVKAQSVGPGRGLMLGAGGEFAMRCAPAGLMTAEAPLEVVAHVLRFPGAGAVRVAANVAAQQGGVGDDVGGAEVIDLDTTVWATTIGASAVYSGGSSPMITLAGDVSGSLQVGWAAHASGRVSVIRSIEVLADPVRTALALEHPFSSAPPAGSAVQFGPWSYAAYGALHAPVGAGDDRVWRGLRLESAAAGKVIVFSMSAWRPGVDGFAIGTFGWGGNGYEAQQTKTFEGSIEAVIREFEPRVWLMMFAQQMSGSSTMTAMLGRVRSAAPGVAAAWLGDMSHSVISEVWHRHILENAQAEGLPAVSLLRHPRFGTLANQYADGLRSDANHISQRGNEALAREWIEALRRTAVVTTPPADIDGDGDVDFADLNYLLSHWGETGPLLAADLDGNGVVEFTDLNVLLSQFGL